jgi:arylsulfatase A-like enzyme
MKNMQIRFPIRLIIGALALVTEGGMLSQGAAQPARGAEPAIRPNIVVILADDQGWGDVSSNGNPNLDTPNIDSLARDGITFDRFFVAPLCAPTRAEFLTGRYHLRTGVWGVDNGRERLALDEKTIGQVFKAGGFATGLFGKWHNGSQWPYHPNARGFDEFYGFCAGHMAEYFDPPLEHNGRFVRGRGYIADDLTAHAIAFIEQNRNRPFFCYLALNTPHNPFSVPDEYWRRFEHKAIELRGSDGERENLAVTRSALAMCENIDANVGRVLRTLDEHHLRENTIVIYFSDNGPNSSRWNGGMKGRKGSTDEGGVRVPFFIRWPGQIAAGITVREIAGAIDLLPTLAQLARIPLPSGKPLDGLDISPLLLGKPRAWPDRTIIAHQAGRVSVRSQRYRLDERGALFDMVADPAQHTDVHSQHTEVADRLGRAVAGWREEIERAPAIGGAPKDIARVQIAAKTPDRRPRDSRPYPVGYAEFPLTVLALKDAVLHGSIRGSGRWPDHSYFTHWTSIDDAITWDIEVQQTGDYEVALYYTCPESDVGSTVELSFKTARLAGKIAPAWDPPVIDRQDRVPRQESYMKQFRPLALGTIHLEAGRGPLTLRATRIAGAQVMDLSGISLTLLR